MCRNEEKKERENIAGNSFCPRNLTTQREKSTQILAFFSLFSKFWFVISMFLQTKNSHQFEQRNIALRNTWRTQLARTMNWDPVTPIRLSIVFPCIFFSVLNFMRPKMDLLPNGGFNNVYRCIISTTRTTKNRNEFDEMWKIVTSDKRN